MKQHILDTALRMAETQGLRGLSRNALAKRAGVSGSLVVYYFGGTPELHSAVLHYALRKWNAPVVAEGIMAGRLSGVEVALCRHICDRVMCAAGEGTL